MTKELKWFKFYPASWMMGRIMRERKEVQADFLRLCCLYWFNQCEYSLEDAEIECGEDSIQSLLKKKIITEEDGNVRIEFLDQQNADVQTKSKVRSEAARSRWDKQKDTKSMQSDAIAYNTDKIKSKTRQEKSFTPPSIDEVRKYCEERNNGVDPSSFINFYESKGWLIGKTKMKDWRAAVRTWENRNPKPQGENKPSYQRRKI